METKPIISPVEAVMQEMRIAPIVPTQKDVWIFGAEENPTKETIERKSQQVMSTNSPLETFLEVKFMEKVIEGILANKEFRTKVKEAFLEQTGGEVKEFEPFGIKVSPVSQVKKNMLSKPYIYSEQVNIMEKEIEEISSDLDLKKQAVKLLKTIEINNGTAKEYTVESLFPEDTDIKKEGHLLDDFDLKVTFKAK